MICFGGDPVKLKAITPERSSGEEVEAWESGNNYNGVEVVQEDTLRVCDFVIGDRMGIVRKEMSHSFEEPLRLSHMSETSPWNAILRFLSLIHI